MLIIIKIRTYHDSRIFREALKAWNLTWEWGRVPGELAPYVDIFDSVEIFSRLFCASCGKFAADIPNYSNVVEFKLVVMLIN
jgi:hypothetical protein